MAKILHLVDSLDAGGMERLLLNLANVQVSQGHEVRIGCLLRKGALADEAEKSGIGVSSFEKLPGFDFAAMGKIASVIKEFKPDYIHSHNAVPNYISALAAFLCGRRIDVNTRHDMGEHNVNWRLTLLYRFSLAATNHVVTVCEAARRTLANLGQAPISRSLSIRNGVPVAQHLATDASARANSLLEELNLAPNTPIVISVGRLTAIKGLELLIDSFYDVLKQVPNAVLLIAGTGDQEGSLRSRVERRGIEKSVRFLGFRTDTYELMKVANVFVQTSLSEGYSLALVEACVAGLPIVASDVGGNSEIVTNGSNGVLIKSRVPMDFANEIVRYLKDSERRSLASRFALRWAQEHASVEVMADKYWLLYKDSSNR